LRVYLGVDPDTRQRRYATRTVHGTRRAASAALVELVETTAYSRLRAGTVGELLERWMSAAAPAWSASTVRETRSLMRCHLLPHLGHVPVAKLTAADIDDVYAYLLRRGGRDGRPLSTGTVHRVHVVLHRALTQAVRWEWVWLNPAALASPPRVEPPEIRPPSVEQVRRLLDVVRAEDIDFFTYLHLAVMTGARRSQLLALRWSDVDFHHAAIGFCRALVDGPTGPVLRPTKNRRTYRVALDPTSVELLLAHRDRAAIRSEGVVDGFVFSRDAGRHPWRPNWVTKRFIADRRRAGLAAFRLHDLRHFMATTMLAAGVPVPVVSERLCHARTSTTVNIYAHAMPGGDRDAVNLLAELLTPAPDRAGGPTAHTGAQERVP
jgi:integrase